MPEYTVNTEEKARIPSNEEAEALAVLTAGCIPAYMGSPVDADDNRIVTTVDWDDSTLTIAAQPDVPRNLTAVLTDANASITAGLLTFVGYDAQGRPITEVMDMEDGLTWAGVKIFATVTSAIITATAGTPLSGTDMVIVGVGDVIGTCIDLSVTSEVVHVWLGAVKVTPSAITVGASLSGIDVNAATMDGAKWLWAMLKPTKNA